jgi:hypothetical protein
MPEPVFGIIASVLGFRQFLLRGLNKVRGEWSRVTMAWTLKRMFTLCSAHQGGARASSRKTKTNVTNTGSHVAKIHADLLSIDGSATGNFPPEAAGNPSPTDGVDGPQAA